jgi:ribosome-associated protein
MEDIKITGDYIELIRLLKFIGMADSGTTAKLMVDEGLVNVDGQTEYRKRAKIRKGSIVETGGRKYRIV